MDGIADAGGVVGRSATYAVAREEPVFVERCGRLYYEHWLGALEDRLVDCGSILTDAATVRAQELANRPTDNDQEH